MKSEQAAGRGLATRAAPAVSGRATRTAGLALIASAPLSAVGAACLIGMYVGFAIDRRDPALALGAVNDWLAVVTTPLIVPAILVLRPILRETLGGAGDLATAVGLVAAGAITGLQLLLVLGVLPFEQQIGPVTVAFVALGAWFTLVGWAGRRHGLPVGVGLGVAAGLYVGYPFWALRLGRYLVGG